MEQWQPIETAPHNIECLVAGGTYTYDAEYFPEERPFDGVWIARYSSDGEWEGPYGEEYDGTYWLKPKWWMPLPPPPLSA
jgi:hypothetical protein